MFFCFRSTAESSSELAGCMENRNDWRQRWKRVWGRPRERKRWVLGIRITVTVIVLIIEVVISYHYAVHLRKWYSNIPPFLLLLCFIKRRSNRWWPLLYTACFLLYNLWPTPSQLECQMWPLEKRGLLSINLTSSSVLTLNWKIRCDRLSENGTFLNPYSTLNWKIRCDHLRYDGGFMYPFIPLPNWKIVCDHLGEDGIFPKPILFLFYL